MLLENLKEMFSVYNMPSYMCKRFRSSAAQQCATLRKRVKSGVYIMFKLYSHLQCYSSPEGLKIPTSIKTLILAIEKQMYKCVITFFNRNVQFIFKYQTYKSIMCILLQFLHNHFNLLIHMAAVLRMALSGVLVCIELIG